MKALSGALGNLLIIVIAGVLAIGFFIAFVAPGMPRTPWGWLMALVLGLPLLLFVDVVFDLTGSRRHRRRGGWVWWAAAFAICAVVLLGVGALLSSIDFLRAQFR